MKTGYKIVLTADRPFKIGKNTFRMKPNNPSLYEPGGPGDVTNCSGPCRSPSVVQTNLSSIYEKRN